MNVSSKPDANSRNTTIGRWLVAGRVISSEQFDWLLRDTQLTQERIEDAIVYRGMLPELELLKFLAAHHRTRFVSTDRLAKAEIDKATLGMIPRKVAETFGVFPVIFEAPTRTLSVVTADPDNAGVLQEIKGMSAAREIKALVARPAAIRAAILKGYAGDAHSFAMLGTVMQYQGPRGPDPDRLPQPSARPPAPKPTAASPAGVPAIIELDDGPGGMQMAPAPVIAAPAVAPPPPAKPAAAKPPKPPPPKPATPKPVAPETFQPDSPDVPHGASGVPPQARPAAPARPPTPAAAMPPPAPPPAPSEPGPPAVALAPPAPAAESDPFATAPPAATASAQVAAVTAPPIPSPLKGALLAAAGSPIAPSMPAHAKPTLVAMQAVRAAVAEAEHAEQTQADTAAPPEPDETPTAPPPIDAEALVATTRGVDEAPPSSDRIELPDSRRLGAVKLRRSPNDRPMQAAVEIQAQRPSSLPPASARATMPPGADFSRGKVDPDAVSELVNVLVSLLDSGRQELRGHSALVGRLVRRLGERLSLPTATVSNMVLGAQLHDVGKGGSIHLTPLNVHEYESYKAAAQKALMTPTRLLAGARLPAEALVAIEQMYERFDGGGIPAGLAGKEISIGARIIAIADAYADLIENTGNEFRRQLTPKESCDVLVKNKGTLFDPALVDLFTALVLGDDMRAKLLSNRHRALLVDPDAEETTVLELRLIEQGFEVRTVRTVELAVKALSGIAVDFDLVISELDLGRGDGLQLLERARKESWGRDLPWVVYTRRQVRDEVQRAFELGALDFVAKPAQPDIFVAKLKAFLEQRNTTKPKAAASGVSGSLKEMGLPDLVQILAQGRKTGSLRIRSGGGAGEVHFDQGAVVNALWGTRKGTDAFYEMVKLTDGEFAIDSEYKPTERLIQDSAEGLLLEGLRRLDEGL